MSPCGCGKSSTTPPLAAAKPRPAPPPRQQPTVQGSAVGGFILQTPGRLPQRFDSQIAADAANVRAGGRGTVVPA